MGLQGESKGGKDHLGGKEVENVVGGLKPNGEGLFYQKRVGLLSESPEAEKAPHSPSAGPV